MLVRACWVLLLLCVFRGVVRGREVAWRHDSDISNRENWIGGKLAGNCKGIHFSEVNTASVYIGELTTAELTLPVDGEILLGSFIEFKDNNKCIKLKPLNVHNWYDPDSWVTGYNAATPDKLKIPCEHDDVFFPLAQYVRISPDLFGKITVGSLKLGNLPMHRSMEWHIEGRNEPLVIDRTSSKCQDPNGCLCHSDFVPCYPAIKETKPECINPITPEESCHEICGAYLTMKIGKGPNLQEIKKKLQEYSVDTDASRVKDYVGKEVLQVVFSEKEYSGKSTEEAEDFFRFLESSEAENVQIFKSGHYLIEGGTGAWSFVLGTLSIVAVFFGVMFYLYRDGSINLINRFSTARGSIFAGTFFARFDNTDENLIIDGQSESGSVLDLPKSFDNPLYGAATSSEHENPLYDSVSKEAEE